MAGITDGSNSISVNRALGPVTTLEDSARRHREASNSQVQADMHNTTSLRSKRTRTKRHCSCDWPGRRTQTGCVR